MKKCIVVLLMLCITIFLASCESTDLIDQFEEGKSEAGTTVATPANSLEKEEAFYTLAKVTSNMLDDVAQDIYTNWYDSIYEEKFGGDINQAIDAAIKDNQETVSKIDANTELLKNLYKETKDGELHDEIKEVMQAYNDYYYLVFESNCSFNEYKEARNPLKQKLFQSLDRLDLEV